MALVCILAVCGLPLVAQAPATATPQVHADMNRLMRGVLYPAANVVFSAQADDPAEKTEFIPGHDPAMSTDPLTSTFGGWVAIENAALALAESANLLLIPGRVCSNGTPAPIEDPSWVALVLGMRRVSLEAYEAAQEMDMEKMIEISLPVSDSCDNCHRRWRNRRGGGRCQ
jgi:hypothetical protein